LARQALERRACREQELLSRPAELEPEQSPRALLRLALAIPRSSAAPLERPLLAPEAPQASTAQLWQQLPS
jgi:hypothetical protein